MDFNEMIQQLMNRTVKGEVQRSTKPVAKLTIAEIVRFEELIARQRAADADYERTKSKIRADRDRLWADLMDRYKLHGKNLSWDGDHLYELRLGPAGAGE